MKKKDDKHNFYPLTTQRLIDSGEFYCVFHHNFISSVLYFICSTFDVVPVFLSF